MNLEKRYDICKDALEISYLQLQKRYHPDNNLDQVNRLEIMNQAIEINKAYETLKDAVERAIYMLELDNISLDSSDKIESSMLLDILERREYIESVDDGAMLTDSLNKVRKDISDLYTILIEFFSKNNSQAALSITIQLKYLVNIEKTIKNKLSQWH